MLWRDVIKGSWRVPSEGLVSTLVEDNVLLKRKGLCTYATPEAYFTIPMEQGAEIFSKRHRRIVNKVAPSVNVVREADFTDQYCVMFVA